MIQIKSENFIVLLMRRFGVVGICIWPFIFMDPLSPDFTENHELIHAAQIAELWVVGFYITYILQFLGNFFFRYSFNYWKSYDNVLFEMEAYKYQRQPGYLKTRQPFAWKQLKSERE